jgi:hypothetical protein
MILGMSVRAFTVFHVALSFVGLLSGVVVVLGMLNDMRLPRWTALFVVTTIATSATGFLFHSSSFDPPQVVGVISLIVLTGAVAALYIYRLSGGWRSVYVAAAVLALYLNAFVGIAQAFQKIPLLQALAPTGSEPPFLLAQAVVLMLFVLIAVLSLKRFHPSPVAAALNPRTSS